MVRHGLTLNEKPSAGYVNPAGRVHPLIDDAAPSRFQGTCSIFRWDGFLKEMYHDFYIEF
jgi:hypothetical protein